MKNIRILFENIVLSCKSDNLKAEMREDEKSLRILHLNCISEKLLSDAKELNDELRELNWGGIYFSSKFIGDFDIGEVTIADFQNDEITLTVQKTICNEYAFFITLPALSSYISQTDKMPETVYVLDDFKEFSTYTTSFCAILNDNHQPKEEWSGAISPQKVVRDFSNRNLLTQNISQWLIIDRDIEEVEGNSTFNEIKSEFAKKLFLTLPTEIVLTSELNLELVFSSEQIKKITFEEIENKLKDYYKDIREIVIWLYENKVQVETKSLLLHYQFVLNIPNNMFELSADSFRSILSNAKNTYSFHLNQSSKDFLKTLTELKKNLSDEFNSLNEMILNLVRSLWRDFFIALAIYSLKFLSLNNINEERYFFLTNLTAVFVGVSFMVTLVSESRFLYVMHKNREDWFPKIYSFIDKSTKNNLINKPLKKLYLMFAGVSFVIFTAYLFIVLVLTRRIFY